MVLLRPFCLSALLVLTSCWTPVFNQDLSVAALIRNKLHLEYSTPLPLNISSEGASYQAAMPHLFGNTTVVSSTHNRVDELPPVGIGASDSLDYPLGDPLQVVVQSFDSTVAWFIPTKSNSTGGRGSMRSATMGIYAFPVVANTDLLGFYVEQDATGTVSAYYLTRNSTSIDLWLNNTTVTGSIFNPPSSPAAIANIPFDPDSPGWMAVDASGPTVYFSTPADSDGKYVTSVFDATGLIASWKGRDHVVAFLSTGRLLTKEGVFYNVCNSSGKILYSFPAGSLRFSGEYRDPTTFQMRSRFSEGLVSKPDQGQETLRVRIYSLRTDRLDTLQ